MKHLRAGFIQLNNSFDDFIMNTDKACQTEMSGRLFRLVAAMRIKTGGRFPIVNSVRALSYEKKITAVSTFERIKELNNIGMIDRAFAEEIIEAYNFLLEIRLRERLYKINIGQKPDNYINPSRLSKLERDLLRDVLKITDKLKKFIFNHFKLGYLS